MLTQQPRVFVIPPSYFDENRTIGGGERYALEYAGALARLTPTTLVLFGLKPRVERVENLTIRTFTVRHFQQRFAFPASVETIQDLANCDVVHAMVFPTPLTDLLILLARMRRQRVVLTDIGGGGPCWSTRLAKLSRRLDLNRWVHGMAHLSHYSATPFASRTCRHTVLHGGIRETDVAARADGDAAGYALYVGRLLAHKGVLELIRAVSPVTPLRIVGRPYDADYFAQLRQEAVNKEVTFHTSADDRELAEHYRGASVVVQPSLPDTGGKFDRSELLGLVALEGMSWGKPVVVTRTASLPESSLDGVTGCIVPPHNLRALGEAVSRFVANPALSREVGAAARKHVLANFTWSQAARRGLDLYRRLRPQKVPANHG